VVEGNARPVVSPREVQNRGVLGGVEPDLTHVNRIPPFRAKHSGGLRRESLVKQNAPQATRFSSWIWSSTEAAA
jgi:hypothetical protein